MNYFQRYLAEEFAEDYQDGRISRREALKLIASVTGSMLTADALLAACSPAPQVVPAGVTADPTAYQPQAGVPVTAATGTSARVTHPAPVNTQAAPGSMPQVSPNDPALQAGAVEFTGQDGARLFGYQAAPKGPGPFAVVLVCHENRGLTPYIQDVTRRLAKAGYLGLAVDLLSRQGGTPALGADQIPGALGNTPPDQFVQDFKSGWSYLGRQSFARPAQVGMVGFCFGGGVTWQMAIHLPELCAAVPYYGPLPPVQDVASIHAPVLAFYGGLDQRINQSIPPVETAMQQHGKVYEKVIYPDADHAFHNDTGPRYNPQAAQDAWKRTLDWFGKYLV
jgi:carboxymethylenebutenolidase